MKSLEYIPRNRCQLHEFNDDDTYRKRAKHPRQALEDLKNTIEDVWKFLDSSGLQLSPEKYQLCVFRRDNKVALMQWSLTIAYKVVKLNLVFKLLGLYFENTLKCDTQIDSIREICLNSFCLHLSTFELLGWE